MSRDQPVTAAAGPAGIEPPAVSRWLAGHIEGVAEPVEFSLVSGGRSNLTYRVTDAAGAVWALRRPPTGGVLSTAHDMSREWRFISALASTGVPVPHPLGYCADPALTGAEFYVMSYVDGVVLADEESAARLSPAARRTAGFALIDVLVALHAVGLDATGLGDLARPEGYVERQLRRWRRRLHEHGSPYLALLDHVHDALAAHIPEQTSGIVHGDYRPGNLAFAEDGRVVAVFDWELATVGDPLADLGWLIASWGQPGDDRPATMESPSTAPGFPARDELAGRYAKLSGRDLSALPYYVAFARWRMACINVGVRARYLAGVMGDDGYDVEARADLERRRAEAALEDIERLGLA
ncbi:phosphotransferase family protein [Planotetraspora sp. GP83]|uniref:phosphotransferase family protein n=1 Tax=Planotetraspora sp. GP83 TaxID=3156264 RepID=UPI003518D06B